MFFITQRFKNIFFASVAYCLLISFYAHADSVLIFDNAQKKNDAFIKEVLQTALDTAHVKRQTDLVDFLSSNSFSYPGATVIDQTMWHEMELDVVLQQYDKAETAFGSWGLQQLSNPLALQQKICERQNVIHLLLNNEIAFNNVESFLKKVCAVQESILFYCTGPSTQSREDAGFIRKHLSALIQRCFNERIAYEANETFDMSAPLYALAHVFFWSGLMEQVNRWFACQVVTKEDLLGGSLQKFKQVINRHCLGRSQEQYNFTDKASIDDVIQNGTVGDRMLYLESQQGYSLWEARRHECINIVFQDLCDYIICSLALKNVQANKASRSCVQKRLVEVAQLFRHLGDIVQLVEQYPQFESCDLVKNLMALLRSNDVESPLQQIITMFSAATFDASSDWFYWRGLVAQVDDYLKDHKQELLSVVQAVAELDGYLTIAKIYQEHAQSNARFSFVEFINVSHACLILDDCWLPLIPVEQVVTNSIALGVDGKGLGAMLTGPHGGGKSTIMKAVAYGIMLGQAWGIAPAAQATMTVFGGMRVSKHTQDDTRNGISGFMADDASVKQMTHFMRAGSANNKCFIMLDETYRTALSGIGNELLWEFGALVATLPHCAAVIATHFEKPIYLADSSDGYWCNYYPEIIEQGDTFIRTHKLLRGVPLWWFGDHEKCMRFARQLGL